jgi:signal transduction histidine kinase
VAEAVLVLGDRRRKARQRDFDPDRLRALGSRAARQWATPVPGAGRCLPALAARLRQLDRLTTDFSRELELQKLTALKEFAYGAGHEINNPLANIATRAQTLLRDETDPERRRALATINSQVFRAHEMITDVMLFARPPEPVREAVDWAELVATVSGELGEAATQQQTVLETTFPESPLTTAGDKEQLAAMLKALGINALEAIGHGGRLRIEVQCSTGDEPAGVRIVVSDTGPGIPADVREHIFDPFFSGREAGRGLGFGLSKAWRIVNEHRGRIDVSGGPAGHGAVFTITLPAGGGR